MGWGDCGTDSKGRSIGYVFDAICDHPGCDKEINRGLSYACGGMHGDCGGQACEKYFCTDHLYYIDEEACGDFACELDQGQLCESCLNTLKEEMIDYIISGDYKVVDNETT